ncbi:ribonuclease J [Terriglobus aquaticus]|uniref:Ribonuclease J n=1 Tax=Terriglobus aquaticus TaxID=940139 RepID=A0ABW9KKR8_9BACT|nr:ribonuclease J [Terriglobus aquaticus]
MSLETLKIVPLGGLGEFGMNCMAVQWKDDIVVIDAGLMFPEDDMLGVNIVVPDISFLTENREKVRGILLTHGHEDHIGGLPWILSELNVPVYGTEFTLTLVEGKLEEHKLLDDADLIEMLPGSSFELGPFRVSPLRVTHSLVDCVALAIRTPVGTIVHTGDFKIDLSSPDGHPFDLQSFAELGKEGVLLLMQDSTNVDRPGFTPGELAVLPRLDEIFARTERRLFFTCFSSSIHRIKLAMDLAHKHGRKVALIGRSMDNATEIAQDLGYIDPPPGLLIHSGQLKDMPPEKVCVLISGTQGEPMSALSRAAVDNHKHARIEAGDTVVFSSRVIPGNEKPIYNVIDHLYRRKARVIHDDGRSGLIHVSGHASQEELRLMINLLRPKYFIPVHGDYRHLTQHVEVAVGTGIPQQAMLVEDGEVIELTAGSMSKTGKVATGRVLIDSGSATEAVEEMIIRDRKHLSEGGLVLAIITIDKMTGRQQGAPEIVTRGFAVNEQAMATELRQTIAHTIESSSIEERRDWMLIKEKVRSDLKRQIQKSTGRRPMIMPVILEI